MRTRQLVIVLIIVLLTIISSEGWAQEYPGIHYLYSYQWYASGGMFGGLDWSTMGSSVFYTSEDNPLCVDSLRYIFHHDEENPDFDVDIDEIRPFDGDLQLFTDYFILRSPGRYHPSMTMYRISKINYQGYYLEDCLSNSLDPEDYYLKAWHYYDDNMRLLASVIKYSEPLSYQRKEYIVDLQGRRIEEMHYSSPDSLDWQATKRITFEYGTEPFGESRDFEKHALYTPDYLMQQCGYSDFIYLNNDYPIYSTTIQMSDAQGQWYNPETNYISYSQIPEEEEIYISDTYHGYQNRYDNNGLLLETGVMEYDELPSFYLSYQHSTDTSIPHSPQIPQITMNIWPNPVKQIASLHYSLAKAATLSISTYNIKGQLLKKETYSTSAQNGEILWSPTDAQGRSLCNGIYFVRLEANGSCYTKKLIVGK
ncbi:MAG: T9SS type A sorting domain-containing protein [Candidatus Cloacimonetes bacterium]|nr:T9SS type A sorting domain-containing protein [Candidatus Cloacimonadota bacterium]MDD2505929.1 T9SS type A sorting domain-containing protein [Candidatus Cloacimonadota bacterium]MDD4147415.1 T9SS type A sorting domain-containing protein [Candidatus Cloacimonadota bacterium]MDD4559531.1 T9SS type A sorting domain-containing protein [Candidatus Cloacimonadota bacterium]